MLKSAPSHAVSLLLAAAYLAVGAGGDALYYLLESPAVCQGSDQDGHGGFSHDHGDGLWHHHGSPRKQPAQDSGGPAARTGSAGHQDHTCLLLAVASAVEVSLNAGPPTLALPPANRWVGLQVDAGVASAGLLTLGARGPPGDALV